jgi:hypothetical protein
LILELETKPAPYRFSVSAGLPGETADGVSGRFKKGTGLAAMVLELIWMLRKPSLTVTPAASVTVASKNQVPPAVGVPLMVPVAGFRVRPSGTAPPTRDPVRIGPSKMLH